jgi:hypothetical protein
MTVPMTMNGNRPKGVELAALQRSGTPEPDPVEDLRLGQGDREADAREHRAQRDAGEHQLRRVPPAGPVLPTP